VKKERRIYYRQLQASFSDEQYKSWNYALKAPLLEVAEDIPQGSLVAVYQAKHKEADLSCLFHRQLHFCFPKVLSRSGLMEFRLVEKVTEHAFEKGAYGIWEPKAGHTVVEKAEIHSCFIPLLAFDGTGRRLGQGRGFYDRFLEGFAGKKIGVGFEWQFSPDDLAVEPCDQHLDLAVTEYGLRKFR
jgi:5-formyltetrahydrofolate cyclo-ligase